jgi:hypothetical protein
MRVPDAHCKGCEKRIGRSPLRRRLAGKELEALLGQLEVDRASSRRDYVPRLRSGKA